MASLRGSLNRRRAELNRCTNPRCDLVVGAIFSCPQAAVIFSCRPTLADAIAWPDIESSYISTGRLGMAEGSAMLKHLRATDQPLVHIENASDSGSGGHRRLLSFFCDGSLPSGTSIHLFKEGAFDIDGGMVVSPYGGLVTMGHPLGSTGVGQIAKITMQLRDEAGARQHKGAENGLGSVANTRISCSVCLAPRAGG
ncbi:thiolase C-terminal domain-containing protein [Bradyrhizobium sp. CCBAU 11434]|uniref:thiolase C-terminal domain-containing protein n=1 Tax=Bradyrhizobium sp. CCBAU 11434 TaxID=1630885 RepID=UPI003FA4C37A